MTVARIDDRISTSEYLPKVGLDSATFVDLNLFGASLLDNLAAPDEATMANECPVDSFARESPSAAHGFAAG